MMTVSQFLKRITLQKLYLKTVPVLQWHVRHKRRLKPFDNLHRGENCFIIGNGPSLNKMDLSPLKHCMCFGLNKIHMHPDIEKFGVNYHVAVNPLVIEQSFNDFKSLNCQSFLSFRGSLGLEIKSSDFKFILTGGRQEFCPDPYSKLSEGHTVTFVALQLAYFMGFTKVFLIGIDHNFLAQGKPNEKQTLQGSDPNHFHPDYFSGQEWQLPDLAGSETAFRLAREHFQRNGRVIYDATVDGQLSIFPKIDFINAVALCNE